LAEEEKDYNLRIRRCRYFVGEFAKVELKYFMYLDRNYINKKAQAGDELLYLRFSVLS